MTGNMGFALNHVKLQDMRAVEKLKVGDRVRVEGSYCEGVITKFDADQRLARLQCGGNYKWFYVKDLRKVKRG